MKLYHLSKVFTTSRDIYRLSKVLAASPGPRLVGLFDSLTLSERAVEISPRKQSAL